MTVSVEEAVQFPAELSKLVTWMHWVLFTCFTANMRPFPSSSLGFGWIIRFLWLTWFRGFFVSKSATFTHLQPIGSLERGIKTLPGFYLTRHCREAAARWRSKGRCTLASRKFRIIKNNLLFRNVIDKKGATHHKLVQGLLVHPEILLEITWSSL